LTTAEKKSFDKYLKERGDVKRVFFVAFSLLLFSGLFLNFGVTGNIVSDAVGEQDYSIFAVVIGVVFIPILAVVGIVFLFKKVKHGRFQKHFAILDNIGISKIADKYK